MIICLGTTPAVQRSLTFDRLMIDGVNRTADVRQYASGKSVNAARALHTLGTAVMCTGFAGGDSGRFLVNDLDQLGVEHHFVRVEPATRMCITLVNREGGTATELIEESQAVGPEAYSLLREKLGELLEKATGVMLSGSLPPEAPPDFYRMCVMTAVAVDKPVLLDATGEPLRQALAARPTIIKPNRAELSQTVKASVQTDADLKSAIRQLLALGPQWAVVTDGPRETVASDGTRFWKIPAPTVKVISPIGSGDSFAAGLMAGVSAGQSVPEACRLAAACGAANAMTAYAGHLAKADVDALVGQISVFEF